MQTQKALKIQMAEITCFAYLNAYNILLPCDAILHCIRGKNVGPPPPPTTIHKQFGYVTGKLP